MPQPPLLSAGGPTLPAGAAPLNYQDQRGVRTVPEVNLAGGSGRQAARPGDLAATLPLFHPQKSFVYVKTAVSPLPPDNSLPVDKDTHTQHGKQAAGQRQISPGIKRLRPRYKRLDCKPPNLCHKVCTCLPECDYPVRKVLRRCVT